MTKDQLLTVDGHLFTTRHSTSDIPCCIYCKMTKDAYENLKSYGKDVQCNPESKGH